MSDMFIFFIGVCCGLMAGWWMHERLGKNITVNCQVDPKIIAAWLESQGMTIMPKGKEFKWPTQPKA